MRWIVTRLIRAVVTIYVVISLTFFLVRLMPGNPIQTYIETLVRNARIPREKAYLMAQDLFGLNLDRPLWEQYFEYMMNVFRGNLGTSINIVFQTPVIEIIARTLPWTIFVVSISMMISFAVGVLLGMFIAYRRNTLSDHIITTVSSILSAVPAYVTALLFLWILYFQLGIGAKGGTYNPFINPGMTWQFIGSVLNHAFLPILSYVILSFGGWVLAMKGATLGTLGEDYVMAAEARGLRRRRIILSYVGRNSIIPVFTSLAINIGYMFGGAIFVETVFSYKGMGYLIGSALGMLDYPVIQGCFLVITVATILANFIADLLYSKLDPRIQREGGT